MERKRGSPIFRDGARVGSEAALLEIEHQADHWDTPDHGETGKLIAEALRSTVGIARNGGLRCDRHEHADPKQPWLRAG